MKVGLVSLGCPKNLVDSEVMMGQLKQNGYEITADAGEADTVVVNTCGFIESAKQESIETILDAARLKTGGKATRLIVAGCLVERYRDELKAEMPEVDAFMGIDQVAQVTEIVHKALERRKQRLAGESPKSKVSVSAPLRRVSAKSSSQAQAFPEAAATVSAVSS